MESVNEPVKNSRGTFGFLNISKESSRRLYHCLEQRDPERERVVERLIISISVERKGLSESDEASLSMP